MAVFGFDERTTHVGFTDESSWNEPNLTFRSVACVSARVEHYCEIESRLYAARCRAGAKMAELKWSEDRRETHRSGEGHQRDAEYILNTALELAFEQKLRMDVVIWNKHDQASLEKGIKIREKPDEWQLHDKYVELLTFLIKHWRSDDDSSSHFWSIATDQHSGLRFNLMQNQVQRDVISEIGQTVVEILEEEKTPNYSLQLVDVFAGLGAYSHNHWRGYDLWLQRNKQTLSELSPPQAHLRFPLLNHLHERCKVNNFGVSILEPITGFRGKGLWTSDYRKLEHYVNFWCYTS